jgi:serine/threonine protein kinase
MVLEWLQGCDLAEVLQERGALRWPEALRVTLDALDALACAHEAGIVHKDLKPANLFLVSSQGQPRVKVLDFGVAHLAAEESMRLTRNGRPACTPAYAAPEYLTRLLVTPAIDVYQMGLLLVELLTGRRAVPHDNPLDCINAHLQGWLEIPQHLKAGPLGAVLGRALHRDPARRYPDAGAFAHALRQASRPLRQATAQVTPPALRVSQRGASGSSPRGATAPQDQQVVAAWRALDKLMRLHRTESTDYRAMLDLLRTCLEHGPWTAAAPEWREVEQILMPLRRSVRYHAPPQARQEVESLHALLSRRMGRPAREPTLE